MTAERFRPANMVIVGSAADTVNSLLKAGARTKLLFYKQSETTGSDVYKEKSLRADQSKSDCIFMF